MRNENNLRVLLIDAIQQLHQPRLNFGQSDEIVWLVNQQSRFIDKCAVKQQIERDQHALTLGKFIERECFRLVVPAANRCLNDADIKAGFLGVERFQSRDHLTKILDRLKDFASAFQF